MVIQHIISLDLNTEHIKKSESPSEFEEQDAQTKSSPEKSQDLLQFEANNGLFEEDMKIEEQVKNENKSD